MFRILTSKWKSRSGTRRGKAHPRPVLLASRDLPAFETMHAPALPRTPEPFSESELVFARRAAKAGRASHQEASGSSANGLASPMSSPVPSPVPSIATGADLRALLERIERNCAWREALAQATAARQALQPGSAHSSSMRDGGCDIGQDVEAALTAALGTLRRMTEQARRQAR